MLHQLFSRFHFELPVGFSGLFSVLRDPLARCPYRAGDNVLILPVCPDRIILTPELVEPYHFSYITASYTDGTAVRYNPCAEEAEADRVALWYMLASSVHQDYYLGLPVEYRSYTHYARNT